MSNNHHHRVLNNTLPPPPIQHVSELSTLTFDLAHQVTFKQTSWEKKKQSLTTFKTAKMIVNAELYHKYSANIPTYSGLCSAPSMFPSPRYCDLTHLHALYTDPLTRLNYHDVKQFEQARNLSREQIRARLEMRNKQSMLQLD